MNQYGEAAYVGEASTLHERIASSAAGRRHFHPGQRPTLLVRPPPSPRLHAPPRPSQVPGPGAHSPHFQAQSVLPTAASYSMAGTNGRTDLSAMAPDSPGPAAYGLPSADRSVHCTFAMK